MITTAASTASCGLDLPGPGRFVFFVPASEVTTVAPVTLCDGPFPVLTEVPASFGAGTPPVPATAPEPASDASSAWVPWVVGAAVTLGLAAVVMVYRRRLHRH